MFNLTSNVARADALHPSAAPELASLVVHRRTGDDLKSEQARALADAGGSVSAHLILRASRACA
jgi:hypothetical protein